MFKVHKPFGKIVNFEIRMSNDIICSFAFDDSCGRMNHCGRNYLLITQGDDDLYDEYGLSDAQLRNIIANACLDNWDIVKLICDNM